MADLLKKINKLLSNNTDGCTFVYQSGSCSDGICAKLEDRENV